MSRTCLISSVSVILLLALVGCKKEMDVRQQHATVNTIEQLKTHYTGMFTKTSLNKGLLQNTVATANIEAIQWSKTFWHETDNSYITPVYLTVNKVNTKAAIVALKYLVTQINDSKQVQSSYFVYVITKDNASAIEAMLQQPQFSFITATGAGSSFNGAIINYTVNGSQQYSYTYSNGNKINSQSMLQLKGGEGGTNFANPNEEGCTQVTINWYWQTLENGVVINEVYFFSTQEWQCPPGGGGSNQGNAHNPCLGADSLANNAEYKAKFDSLKSKTTDTVEHGYYYSNVTANSIQETGVSGTGNLALNFNIPSGVQIDGIMHSHFSLPGKSLSIFSDYDLLNMIDLYQGGNMRDPLAFSMGVVTADGTQYMLRIENLSEFSAFANLMKGTFAKTYWTAYGISVKNNNSTLQNESGFLQFIQKQKAGLKLFKGNGSFNSWTPLKRESNGQVVNTTCN